MDIKVINNGTGKYEFDIFRKKAITNVQVKPESSHDPRILQGIFKGFVRRALSMCSDKYIDKELDFLTNTFVENGYQHHDLLKILEEVKLKLYQTHHHNNNNNNNNSSSSSSNNNSNHNNNNKNNSQNHTISLPWIPGLSPKLKKVYRKAGYNVVFKPNKNLQIQLMTKNKTRLVRVELLYLYIVITIS